MKLHHVPGSRSCRVRWLLEELGLDYELEGNIMRVASLLFIASAWGADAAFVFYHDYSGPGFFVVVLALMLPITRLVQCRYLRAEVI